MSIAAEDVAPERAAELNGVVTYRSRQHLRSQHEHDTITEIARRLAALHGMQYLGDVSAPAKSSGKNYVVPDETLSTETATLLGVESERDLFGGVVPFEFVATKAITHPLPKEASAMPDEWSAALGDRLHDATLHGFTAFSEEDALHAASELLPNGAIRIKPVRAKGGRGQSVVATVDELRRVLQTLDSTEWPKFGLVMEENLEQVETLSIGFVESLDLSICYCGKQVLTPNNSGRQAYGGSTLLVARGGPESLTKQKLGFRQRVALEQARRYDRAAHDCYPGLMASRRNYDILQGFDAAGCWHSGVLEQSWRVGGATPAEIAALEAFHREPQLSVVRTYCVERYGKDVEVPRETRIYFQGADNDAGPMVKYAGLVR